jgi:hypothetical protein
MSNVSIKLSFSSHHLERSPVRGLDCKSSHSGPFTLVGKGTEYDKCHPQHSQFPTCIDFGSLKTFLSFTAITSLWIY